MILPTDIQRFYEPERSEWKELIQRASDSESDIEQTVRDILEGVRTGGDKALIDYESRFDGAPFTKSDDLKVGKMEAFEASRAVPGELKDAIKEAYSNIRKFHKAQLPKPVKVKTRSGVLCCQKAVPIRRVGLYIPGGRAPLFSTVLMLAIPAKVAGCRDIVLCTPPDKDGKANPIIVYAAKLCGVDTIYKAGGAQAIAAMAYGTESILKRDKIFGPGNRFVMKAKQFVGLKDAAIDMPAGPSEVMVLADESANPEFVASDFLSQAEHGPDSQSLLVCNSEELASAVAVAVVRQAKTLSRLETVEKSLKHSRIVIFKKYRDIVDFANEYAPEHLIISMKKPWKVADEIYAAGSIFIGNYSPESAGDYASGTNHTLPTSGWARSYSGLNVDAFMRKMTLQELSADGLKGLGDTIRTMALAEGLDAHAAAVDVRLKS